MRTKHYVAILEKASDGGFGIFFPDLPGCTSGGDTMQEAARNAAEALALHVEGMMEEGLPVPEPSDMDTVPRDPAIDEAARLLVSVELPGPAVRANVTIEKTLLARIDAAAAARGMTRSAFLAESARRYLAGS
jgi:predicted RNase H-like HicB family nuclease